MDDSEVLSAKADTKGGVSQFLCRLKSDSPLATTIMDEELVKFYDLVDEIEKLCHKRGEIPLAEIETMALAKEIRPSAILDELAVSDFVISLAEGKVKCR